MDNDDERYLKFKSWDERCKNVWRGSKQLRKKISFHHLGNPGSFVGNPGSARVCPCLATGLEGSLISLYEPSTIQKFINSILKAVSWITCNNTIVQTVSSTPYLNTDDKQTHTHTRVCTGMCTHTSCGDEKWLYLDYHPLLTKFQ